MTGIAPEAASAVERGLDEMSSDRVAGLDHGLSLAAWNARTIPAPWLPVLAWALSLDIWNPDWSEELKRDAIAAAFDQHRLKGTPAGIKLALDGIGAVYEIVERPGGAPFTEAVDIQNLDTITLRSEAELRAVLNRVKRASVHLTVSASAGAGAEISVATGAAAQAFAPAALRLTIDE